MATSESAASSRTAPSAPKSAESGTPSAYTSRYCVRESVTSKTASSDEPKSRRRSTDTAAMCCGRSWSGACAAA